MPTQQIDRPSPEDWESMSSEEREEKKDELLQQFKKPLEDREQELNEQEQEVRDKLLSVAEQQEQTKTVSLNDEVELEIRLDLSGEMYEYLRNFNENQPIDEVIEDLLYILCGDLENNKKGIIVAPEKYRSRNAWRAVYRQHGLRFLLDTAEKLLEPIRDELGIIKNTQGDGEGN